MYATYGSSCNIALCRQENKTFESTASDRIPRRPDSCFTRVPDFLQQVLDALHFLFLGGVEHHDGGPQHTHRTTHLPEQIKTFI